MLGSVRRVKHQNSWSGPAVVNMWTNSALISMDMDGATKSNGGVIYRLQKGRDAQERWSSFASVSCTHLHDPRSSEAGVRQKDHTVEEEKPTVSTF